MPWQEPNSMTAEEGWAVTAYVIKLNRMNPPTLDHERAAQFRLHAEAAKPAATPPTTSPSPSSPSLRIAGAAGLLIIALILVIRIRRQAKASERA
jgi:MYXO-CTERM domain-containing protein